MTRAETAALTLALHVLRRSVRYHPSPCPPSALDTCAWYAIGDARGVVCEGFRDATWYPFPPCGTADGARFLRARLALYLRAVLRAAAIDEWERTWTGEMPTRWPTVCGGCGIAINGYRVGEVIEPGPDSGALACRGATARHPRPLWLDAPEARP